MTVRNCIIFFCFLCPQIVWPQHKTMFYEKYTVRDGLSSNRTTWLMQDSHGYLWIGTEDGLNRFDGKTFDVFDAGVSDSAHSLSNGFIHCLAQSGNNILIGTANGLNVFDLEKNRFNNLLITQPEIKVGSGLPIQMLWTDRHQKTWVTCNDKIYLLGKELKTEKILTKEPSFQRYKEVFNLTSPGAYTKSGGIVLAASQELVFLTEKNGTPVIDSVVKIEINKKGPDKVYFLDEHNLITTIYAEGLFIYNLTNRSLKKIIVPVSGIIADPEHKTVKKIICDRNKQYWAATGSGLLYFDPVTLKHEKYVFDSPDGKENPVESFCRHLIEDKAGNKWVAGEKGIIKIPPNQSRFTSLSSMVPAYKPPILLEPGKIFKDKKGRFWIGSWLHGLQLVNPDKSQTFSFSELLTEKFKATISVYENMPGEFWICTYKGLYIFNELQKTITQPAFIAGSLKQAYTYLAYKDSRGEYWISFVGKGLLHFIPATGRAFYYNHYNINKDADGYLPFRHPTSIAEDKNGNLWMGHVGISSPLVKWVRASNRFYSFTDKPAPFNSGIWDMEISNNDILWIGTLNKGLVRYNITTNEWLQYIKTEGLCNNAVIDITPDNRGNLWLSTANGLSRFDTATKQFQNFSESDGLVYAPFFTGGYFDKEINRIFLPVQGNIVSFNPDEVTSEQLNLSPPLIKKILVDNKRIDSDKEHGFSYNQNHFDFEFTAVNLVDGHKNQYAYKVEGLDKDWVYSGSRNQASYYGIPPGKYTFIVKAGISGGQWRSETASFNFTIRKPFWSTAWFIAICIVVISGIAFAFHRMRINKLLAIEKMRQRFSRDLHDDIGSTLSSINILARTAGAENDGSNTMKKIQQRSQKMLDAMDDIIWSTKPDNDALESLIIRTREYAGEVLEAAGIQYEIIVQENMPPIRLNMEQKKNMYLIIKEAVNNLAKYSQSPTAAIHFTYSNNRLQLLIKDEGVGFTVDGVLKGNGLQNMKTRATEMNAELLVNSGAGKGTAINIKLPL